MKREIKAPSPGESITEVRVGRWRKQDGDQVKVGEVLLELESDKATVEVVAEVTGALKILKPAGETVAVGTVLGTVDEGVQGRVAASTPSAPPPQAKAQPQVSKPHAETGSLSPAVRRVVSETGVDPSQIRGTGRGGRVTKGDLLGAVERGGAAPVEAPVVAVAGELVERVLKPGERAVPMSMLRRRIAERLLEAQNSAALLTTFNECDMTELLALRAKHKDEFKAKHGVSLGFMSFFTRAAIEALKEIPAINARIEGDEIIYHDFYDIGVAVGTERGLVVPVIRDAGAMGFVEIEKKVSELALKARDGKLSIPELTGGTFTISNGGVYGSLLSTPIVNPPQSGILGMHKTQERPVALNGQVVIRPMMYLALTYDHRIVDGKEAVTFLVKVKEGIENPSKLGFSF